MSSIQQYKRQRDEFQLFWGELGDQLERVTGSKLVQVLTLVSLEHGKSSLRGFCRVAKEFGIRISEAGLHQRLDKTAVELLRQMSPIYLMQAGQGAVNRDFSAVSPPAYR